MAAVIKSPERIGRAHGLGGGLVEGAVALLAEAVVVRRAGVDGGGEEGGEGELLVCG